MKRLKQVQEFLEISTVLGLSTTRRARSRNRGGEKKRKQNKKRGSSRQSADADRESRKKIGQFGLQREGI